MMAKKSCILFCFMIFGIICNGQQDQKSDDLLLAIKDSWRSERLTFPISFAPSLDYDGIEEVRFAAGWQDKNSPEFWTYTFLWYLDTNPELTKRKLRYDLAAYFDGLMNLVSDGKSKNFPSEVTVKRIGNSAFYEGEARIYDAFFTKDMITLHVSIEEQYCKLDDKYTVLFRFSPKETDDAIWTTLNAIHLNFKCN